MDSTIMFTVVVPLYNKAPHVARSIASILNQSFTDFEVLVIDDASTDGSVEAVLKFSDVRLRLLHRDTPGPGGYAARNLGISEARGKWIAFLDADDEWFADHLEKMVELTERFPDAQFLSCGWKDAWPDGWVVDDAFFKRHASHGPREVSFSEYLEFCTRSEPPTNTYVACIRNSDFARDLFPAGKAKRGGDLHAWATYLAKARKLAWSPHIGAIYNRDVLNSVTQGAPANTVLIRLLIAELSSKLEPAEHALLLKYCNRRTWDAWRLNALRPPYQTFNLASQLSWRGDTPFCISRTAVSMIPTSAMRFARRVKVAARVFVGTTRAGRGKV